jgi:GTP-binding protein Era
MKEKKDRSGLPLMNIECSIHAEKKSQKAIIIGKSGEMLKKIGTLARVDIEELLEKRVFLRIWVKVVENWTKNESYLTRMGY